MRHLTTIVSIGVLCVTGCSDNSKNTVNATTHPPNPELPAAPEILATMAASYAKCETYSDTGTATTTLTTSDGIHKSAKPFTTSFVRNGSFRFQFSESGAPNSLYVVWTDGNSVLTWWGLNQKKTSESSLELALAGATGVSGGSAHTVPALLIPNQVGGREITDIRHPTRGADASIDDAQCFVIHGSYADSPITLWIEKRQIEQDNADRREENATQRGPHRKKCDRLPGTKTWGQGSSKWSTHHFDQDGLVCMGRNKRKRKQGCVTNSATISRSRIFDRNQYLSVNDAANRTQTAVQRSAPMAIASARPDRRFGTWQTATTYAHDICQIPERPSYRWKTEPSFPRHSDNSSLKKLR